jgi:hypothetical protein
LLGHPVLIATNGGSNFWQGNNPETIDYLRDGYDVQWIPPGELAAFDYRDPEAGRSFLSASFRFLCENPGRIPELLWTKLLTQWSLDITPRRNPSSKIGVASDGAHLVNLSVESAIDTYSSSLFDNAGRGLHRLFWGVSLVFALVGAVATRRQWRRVSLILAVQLGMTAFYVVFHPSTRYRLPGDPLLFFLSAAGLLVVIGAARRWHAAWRDRRKAESCAG